MFSLLFCNAIHLSYCFWDCGCNHITMSKHLQEAVGTVCQRTYMSFTMLKGRGVNPPAPGTSSLASSAFIVEDCGRFTLRFSVLSANPYSEQSFFNYVHPKSHYSPKFVPMDVFGCQSLHSSCEHISYNQYLHAITIWTTNNV